MLRQLYASALPAAGQKRSRKQKERKESPAHKTTEKRNKNERPWPDCSGDTTNDDDDGDGNCNDESRAREQACGMTNKISGAATPPLNIATAAAVRIHDRKPDQKQKLKQAHSKESANYLLMEME